MVRIFLKVSDEKETQVREGEEMEEHRVRGEEVKRLVGLSTVE